MAFLLQHMWGFLNALQLIMLTVLFDVPQPVNSRTILITTLKLLNLDVF